MSIVLTVRGGSGKVPDFAWHDWAGAQVQRVPDLIDVLTLQDAVKGFDQSYKT